MKELDIQEALKLADDLDALHEQDLIDGVAHLSMPQAPAMIRRLVEELEKWKKDLHLQSHVLGFMEGEASKTEEHMILQQPLTNAEIKQIEHEISGGVACYDDFDFVAFARAIEERHGIK